MPRGVFNEYEFRDGEIFVVNRPHIQRVLRSRLSSFLFRHVQNFMWTVDRLIGSEPRSAPRVVQAASPVLPQDGPLAIEQTFRFETRYRLAVIVPTVFKKANDGELFLRRSLSSVREQTCAASVELTFFVGVDASAVVPDEIADSPDVVVARSTGRTQILALNAAATAVSDQFDYVAFLEDDDWWRPDFLRWALIALSRYDFASSTQLEVDEEGRTIGIYDFPTPSTWIMRRTAFAIVGGPDPRSHWHYDCEWLGRLGESDLTRCHMVEQTAPTDPEFVPFRRPWLNLVLELGGAHSELQRHSDLIPLVVRLNHAASGTSLVLGDGPEARESQAERKWLVDRFGHLPS